METLAKECPEIFRTIVFEAIRPDERIESFYPLFGISVHSTIQLDNDGKTVKIDNKCEDGNMVVRGTNRKFDQLHDELLKNDGFATVHVSRDLARRLLPILLCSTAIQKTCERFVIKDSVMGLCRRLGLVKIHPLYIANTSFKARAESLFDKHAKYLAAKRRRITAQ